MKFRAAGFEMEVPPFETRRLNRHYIFTPSTDRSRYTSREAGPRS
jgi:hypothetical protein